MLHGDQMPPARRARPGGGDGGHDLEPEICVAANQIMLCIDEAILTVDIYINAGLDMPLLHIALELANQV